MGQIGRFRRKRQILINESVSVYNLNFLNEEVLRSEQGQNDLA